MCMCIILPVTFNTTLLVIAPLPLAQLYTVLSSSSVTLVITRLLSAPVVVFLTTL